MYRCGTITLAASRESRYMARQRRDRRRGVFLCSVLLARTTQKQKHVRATLAAVMPHKGKKKSDNALGRAIIRAKNTQKRDARAYVMARWVWLCLRPCMLADVRAAQQTSWWPRCLGLRSRGCCGSAFAEHY